MTFSDDKEKSDTHIVNPGAGIIPKMMFGTHIYELEWTDVYCDE